MHPDQIFVIIVASLITGCITLSMFAQAWAESQKKRQMIESPPRLDGIEARLARMEAAIESVAVEIERVAEGQRFAAKLLAERASPAGHAAGARPAQQNDQRSITPH